jgi:DNA-directed RNA polymerase subunit delta
MELKKMSREEIELMSYTDLTYLLLKENKKAMNTADLFKKIGELLELSDDDFESKIGDYYTSLTIDKRFYMLDGGLWDLTEKHKVELQLDDDEEDISEEEVESEDEDTEESEESEEDLDSIDNIDDDLDDDIDDDTLDLSIVTEDELEES